MRGAILHGARDVRFEHRDDPATVEPTDAIIGLSATCVCGSDLWPYRGIEKITSPSPMGHEYVGIIEEVGSCIHRVSMGTIGTQAPLARVPLADSTLVATPATYRLRT
jgi:threonine dehydrogenase-like Zn-dependent dehydrogenase